MGHTVPTPVSIPLTINGSHVMVNGTFNQEYITPPAIEKYLTDMEWFKIGHRWGRKDLSDYYTWEQAVVYCLIKPFLE